MQLYRPLNLEELRLTYEMGMGGFPPRLQHQDIFYPVLDRTYACEIAQRWNTDDEFGAGYVSAFTVDDSFGGRFEPHTVGAAHHRELWVPADELPEFNRHIARPIVVVAAYFADRFRGFVPDRFGLRGKNADEQFIAIARSLDENVMDVYCEILANHTTVFLNYAYWAQADYSLHGIAKSLQERAMDYIQQTWSAAFPETPLPMTGERSRLMHN